jgi:hypothetical protein
MPPSAACLARLQWSADVHGRVLELRLVAVLTSCDAIDAEAGATEWAMGGVTTRQSPGIFNMKMPELNASQKTIF